MHNDPINNIQWLKASGLNINDYNPNVVMNAELKLLELSILKQGWLQPILVNTDLTIIDGFHRAMLAKTSKPLLEKYDGECPCVVMNLSRADCMMLTIRINRAKGGHVAFRMHSIIRELIDDLGVDPTEIATQIGANLDEVALLHKEGVFEQRDIKNYKYSKAWYPAEGREKQVDAVQ